ncbi:hypothetical protein BH11BAC7_BH11BAC7_25180 [soil metagenome]
MTRKILLALTATTLLTGNLFAAAITQYLKVTVTENSNVLVQQPLGFLWAFSANGANGLDVNDMGNQNSISNPGDNVYPFSLSSNNDIITQQDARPSLTGYKKVQFGFYCKNPGTIKVLASAFGNTSDTTNRPAYAWIEQISTGDIYYFFGDTVKLDIPANLDFTADYYLHTGPYIAKEVTDAGCFGSTDGAVSVNNPNCNAWKLSVYKNAILLSSDSMFQPVAMVSNLDAGAYTLVTTINSIPVDSTELVVGGEPEMIADFLIDNYTPVEGGSVTFTDNSTVDPSASYFWTFGDGNTDTQTSTSNAYTLAGTYEVVLTITSVTGCQATVFDSVYVTTANPPLEASASYNTHMHYNSTPDYSTDALLLEPTIADNIYTADGMRIMIAQNESQFMNIIVMNVSGQIISNTTTTDAKIEITVPATGVYIVRIINAKRESQSKTIMVTN